jgi:hypothetical protein
MINIATCASDDISNFGRDLLIKNRRKQISFEGVSKLIVRSVRENFVDEKGAPAFALVRIFRLTRFSELNEALKPLVTNPDNPFMVLMGTAGEEPAWESRATSVGHKVVSAGENRSPMVLAAMSQIGLNALSNVKQIQILESNSYSQYFHVEKAFGSSVVPAQDFVQKHKIQSVIGLGAQFISGSFFLMMHFSRVPLDNLNAKRYSDIAPFIGTLLASYDNSENLWEASN